jgi:UDP-2,3-diacylglucosamine hydrolase
MFALRNPNRALLELRTNIYFASDVHLGVPSPEKSLAREKAVVAWLQHIRKDAKAIYLLGDIFDFWFEYRFVVAKGFVRLLGCLAEMVDEGIEIHFFTGNHDMWSFGYLEKEIGLIVHREPVVQHLHGKTFFIGHGDGLGPNDRGYKMMKWVFAAPFFQWLYGRFHPNFSFGLANYLSGKSRKANSYRKDVFLGEDKEYLVLFIREYLKSNHADYFVFGHRHITLQIPVEGSMYINVGEWITKKSYAVFDGETMKLEYWGQQQ